MSEIDRIIQAQNKLSKQMRMITAQLTPIINTEIYFNNFSEPIINAVELALKQPAIECSKSIIAAINSYQNALKSIPNLINLQLRQNVLSITNSLQNIVNLNKLEMPVIGSEKILESVENSSDYIEQDMPELAKTELDTNIKDVTNSLTKSKQVDWKFIIPLILSLLCLLMQILSNIDSYNSLKSTTEFQANISKSLEKIDNCLEQNLQNHSSK